MTALAALLVGACVEPALAQDRQPRIAVTGEGHATAAPDLMLIDVGIDLVRPTSQRAMADAASRAQELIRALRRAGVAERDLQTRTLQIRPHYEHRDRRNVLVGYRANNTLTVRLRDLDRAGAVLDAAIAAAGDEATLHGVRFEIQDDTPLRRTAREAAWQDASAKARQLAELADVTLGRAISITEHHQGGPSPVMFRAERAMDAASTPIEPGEIAVTVVLDVEFALPQ